MPEFNVRGKVKIEMFNDKNEVVEEVNTNNFISIGMRKTMMKRAIVSLFGNSSAKDPFQSTYLLSGMVRNMYLTDATHAEEPQKEFVVKGEIIGYAKTDATYSGADILRGTINLQESITSIDQVRFVYDFPTSAANGTFRSIYHAGERMINEISTLRNSPNFIKKIPNVDGSQQILFGQDTVDKIYVVFGNGSGYGSEIRIYDKSFNFIENKSLSQTYEQFLIDGDYLYCLSSTNTRTVSRVPLSNIESAPTVVLEMKSSSLVTGMPYMFKDGDGFEIYYIPYQPTSSSYYEKRTSSFELISRVEFKGITSVGGVYKFDGAYRSRSMILNRKPDGSLVSSNCFSEFPIYANSAYIIWELDDYLLMNFEGYVFDKVGIASRALLDAPVTKTSANTMKITYDFLFDE